jgi:hypothetical protein
MSISRVEATTDTLTGRGGLALFVRYLRGTKVLSLLERAFGKLRKSKKGLPIRDLFLQIFSFLMDGTSRHMSYFDELAKDEGYAGVLETSPDGMASSHTMKRFFKSFGWLAAGAFRTRLNHLFLWRLRIERPREVEVSIDTMVMDNDEALKREGVQPTYKKVKGFQPLQMIWNGKIVDAVFRGGKKHSNSGNTVVNMIARMARLIRRACGEEVLIVLRLDSGFFDEKILEACSEHRLAFIVSGKMYGSGYPCEQKSVFFLGVTIDRE